MDFESRERTRAMQRTAFPSPSVVVAAASLFVTCLLARLPLHADYLVNWDSVQFALATEGFDLPHHRPQPPGYIGYVLAGDLLNHVTGDANSSFVVLSLAASALAPAIFLLLALKLLPRARAYATTALFATSPLLWYYGGVALTYAVEAAFAVGFGFVAWTARARGGKWVIGASVLLAMTGAIRPTGELLLFPLWLWAVWPHGRSLRLAGFATLVLATLAWAGPLIWLTGGVHVYWRESTALAESAGGSSWLFSGDLGATAANWGFVLAGVLAMLGAALLPLGWNFRRLSQLRKNFDGEQGVFLLLWLAPALAIFVLGHMGQAGYVLILMAPSFLLIGKLELSPPSFRGKDAVTVIGCLVALNFLIVFWLPDAIYDALPAETAAAGEVRQFVPTQNDAYWHEMVEFIQCLDPEKVVILAATGGPNSSASFRELSYYLPDYHIYGLSSDESKGAGAFYRYYGRRENYKISNNGHLTTIKLGPTVKTVLISDWMVGDDFEFTFPVTEYTLPEGHSIWLGQGMSGGSLVFNQPAVQSTDDSDVKALVDMVKPMPQPNRPGRQAADVP
jgi:hypothetical protein